MFNPKSFFNSMVNIPSPLCERLHIGYNVNINILLKELNSFERTNPYRHSLHDRHAGRWFLHQQVCHQEQYRLHAGRSAHGSPHGGSLAVRQQRGRRLHFGRRNQSLRRLGLIRSLVCHRRFRRHDPPGLVCTKNPQNHGCDHP
ncbi:hypothetical protein SDC9_187477 [bioreactor metagenome]|uniref:Uncharacterized protein n=1 Tax=bioreactor metagenome TaxID=1076179 RepID=A0A645HX89_9ZZZZ